jgi:hypothetical protein
MLQKICLILFVACLLSSCKTGPQVTVCVSDPQVNGLDCYDQRTQKSFFLPYAQSDKYVALPPADAQALFDFCAQKSGGK